MDKQWYKDRIYGYELRIIDLLHKSLRTEPKRTVLKRARRILLDFSSTVLLSPAQNHSLWNWTVNAYNKASRQSWGDPEKIPEALAGQYRAMEKEKNLIADNIEFNFKHDRAMNYINSSVTFYRCSTHSNCADGHIPFQGKIFINTDSASEDELNYARANNILSLRDVMFKEPFLSTRRNCTHVFEPLPTEQVLSGTLPEEKIIPDQPLDSPYRAYYDRKKLLLAAGVSKENDSYKRTVSLIRKYKLR